MSWVAELFRIVISKPRLNVEIRKQLPNSQPIKVTIRKLLVKMFITKILRPVITEITFMNISRIF